MKQIAIEEKYFEFREPLWTGRHGDRYDASKIRRDTINNWCDDHLETYRHELCTDKTFDLDNNLVRDETFNVWTMTDPAEAVLFRMVWC